MSVCMWVCVRTGTLYTGWLRNDEAFGFCYVNAENESEKFENQHITSW